MRILKNNQKILLLKGNILLGVITSILFMFFTWISQLQNIEEKEFVLYNNIAIFLLASGIIECIIMYCLMKKVDLNLITTKSKRLKINTNSYIDFERKLFKELYLYNYEKYKIIPNEINCQIKYLIKRNKNINNIFLIIKPNDSFLSDKAFSNYFDSSLNYIIEKEPYLTKKNTNLIYVICVNKINNNFKMITEKNVVQGYGRFNLPIGISFSTKTIYIVNQKDGFFIFRYNKLVKMFINYIGNQLNT